MSYNGIGLQSARGSGTSGYIQSNLSANKKNASEDLTSGHYKKRKLEQKLRVRHGQVAKVVKPISQAVDKERELSRRVEIQCMELRDELEEKGVSEEQIKQKVNNLRSKLKESKKGSESELELELELNQNKEQIRLPNKSELTVSLVDSLSTETRTTYQYQPRFNSRTNSKEIRVTHKSDE
ncbi:uncharacterized protein CANTADRAFT_8401 [Suhomyces tanzawaensis NRRL Y-17324]|uniref:Pre-mRNA-splicing factor CWC21 n=1 Tax=Suhomyces tanzawaensis NRRL Y-17324 TaxID=984487 RepID=A0A1E4SBA7_9ASCO|nr:uncharacterized protein CANTADRAFT_8401 [Suhomyces tanzawaensis NRRL Y-17324]ODV76810.1 hypothetical protein CANTADRAFT_8401 [Suhomyces tanzawaensis NRRL Y-17324]